jgi:CHAT domain-containing protein/tetratricopeptide (TPR) repeat protein
MSAAIGAKIRVDLPPRHRYQCRMPGARLKTARTACIFLTLLSLALPGWTSEQASAERPAEYMVYQYPDTILVLKIDVREAEFGMRTIGPESALLKSSSLPGRRIGPIYQYIDAIDHPRQLMIEVTPARTVDRAAISLEVLQFSSDDRNSTALVRAYQMLSVGTETTRSTDASTWASKAYSFRNAAGIFASLGREEMRLWSEYFAAHLVLHQLDDPLMALEMVGAVQRDAERAGFPQPELVARMLEGSAVLRLAASSAERPAALYYDRAHRVLGQVAELAGRQAFGAEQGRALFEDGSVYEIQGDLESALDRYEAALEVAAGSGDMDLLNQIRATAASAHEAMGSTSGAIALLDDIADDLDSAPGENADLELAMQWFEKGRLLNTNFRHAEAAKELSRALAVQRSEAGARSWGPTGLELAWSLYALGETDEALGLLEASLRVTPEPGNKDSLIRAYGSIGNIYRERRQFDEAARARSRQEALVGEGSGRAALLFDMGLDAMSRGRGAEGPARGLLRLSQQAALSEGDEVSGHRATLNLCLLDSSQGQGSACRAGATAAHDALRGAGIPWIAADASLARSRLLHRSGDAGMARDSMERLIEELYWYRRAMPGVTDPWYAHNRDGLMREYLSLVRATGSGQAGSTRDGGPLLLAMERIRMLENADYVKLQEGALETTEEESIRALLARREVTSGNVAQQLAGEINRRLIAARRGASAMAAEMPVLELTTLLRQLDESEAVLTFNFDGRHVRALVATPAGVQAIEMTDSEQVMADLGQLRDAWLGPVSPDLPRLVDALGDAMLRPLEGIMPEKVYLLPTGPLRGIPLDALRVNGRYFGERHSVTHLASLGSIERRAPGMAKGFRDRVFLAGNPQEQADPFNLEFRVSPEIAAVTDQFVGPGLHIVQGVALQRHEFQDERFAHASLVHLGLAGTLDLSFPDRSRLILAKGAADEVESGSSLAPADVRSFDMEAQLAVLSGTAVIGHGVSPVDSRVPFVADFMEAGSQAVLVSFRPLGEQANAHFMAGFYDRLRVDPDIVAALSAAKRAWMAADPGTNLPDWASFQLFIR